MVHTDSDTENGHDKVRWVHLWSFHGYTVNLTLDVSRRLKVDHFGHWNIFFVEAVAFRHFNYICKTPKTSNLDELQAYTQKIPVFHAFLCFEKCRKQGFHYY